MHKYKVPKINHRKVINAINEILLRDEEDFVWRVPKNLFIENTAKEYKKVFEDVL